MLGDQTKLRRRERVKWWKSLTDDERTVYTHPHKFTELAAKQIPRYRDKYKGSHWAVRVAIEKILDGQPFPLELHSADGQHRIKLWRNLIGWATIRDTEEQVEVDKQIAMDLNGENRPRNDDGEGGL